MAQYSEQGKTSTSQTDAPPLTDMAPGKKLMIDISPTNDPKYLLAYLKIFSRS